MSRSKCQSFMEVAEERAKKGKNEDATELFTFAGECWERWESFPNAAKSFERAYEHAMLSHQFCLAADLMKRAGRVWLKQGEHEKFEIDFQIAAEAYIYGAEEEKNPDLFIEGAFCAILGGDTDIARHLIHAAAETTQGRMKELVNLALMLAEFQYGDADMYIDAALSRVVDKIEMRKKKEIFSLAFTGFVRSLLESETVVTISSIAESTGMDLNRTRDLVERGIERGEIPAFLDRETEELIIDSERVDISGLTRRKGPILSRDLEDPGAWDMDLDE